VAVENSQADRAFDPAARWLLVSIGQSGWIASRLPSPFRRISLAQPSLLAVVVDPLRRSAQFAEGLSLRNPQTNAGNQGEPQPSTVRNFKFEGLKK
jgi:hypothetical protein